MTIARDLAAAIHALGRTDLDEEAVRWAQIGIADTIAVAIAGSQEPAPRLAMAALGVEHEQGPCLLLGLGRRTGPLTAALVNGVAAHALDFDDVNDTLGGHPSAPLVPALLALGEVHDASGAELLLADVARFETECKIGSAVNFQHYDRGWHPTCTLGSFGSAAASLIPDVSIEPGVPRESDERLAVRVEITTRDGATHDWRVEEAVGTGGARSPIAEPDFGAKFDDCCTRVISADSAARLYARLSDLEGVAHVGDLTALIAEGAEVAAGAR